MTWNLKIVLCSTLVGITIFCLGTYMWAQNYQGRLPPNVRLNGLEVGGMDPENVRQDLQSKIDTILNTGIEVVVDDDDDVQTLSLATFSSGDVAQDVDFKLDETLDQLMTVHKEHSVSDAIAMFLSFLSPSWVRIPVTLQEDRIQTSIHSLFPNSKVLAQQPKFSISFNTEKDLWSIELVDGIAGTEFQWDPFFEKLEEQLIMLQPAPLNLSLTDVAPRIFSQDEKQELVSKAATALQTASSYEMMYEDLTWKLTGEDLATMLAPTDDLHLTLLEEPLDKWIANIRKDVNQTARDARLAVANGRVTDFVESLEGRTLDEEQLKDDLLTMIAKTQEEPHENIELVVHVVEPTITTADVNDLGIDEVLGIGTSSYRGSPTNRRGNIQNGVDLLNGILIAPDETFSLLKALAPFTTENGYLPELVIKGDKITPEIGGGLCQIGTTTFRTAMNSGLPIVQRQNHSLVVSYYNDPQNGNPGTDATIYEPSPDFQFTNNTGHYILFQAENLTQTQQLRFTFWGTKDGRQGSYSPPVVSRWIPVGETQYLETLDLEPGVEQCQSAHIGADASFVYSVVSAQGALTQTTFESHYRPLPMICLVGVLELTPETEEIMSEEESLSTENLAPASDAP